MKSLIINTISFLLFFAILTIPVYAATSSPPDPTYFMSWEWEGDVDQSNQSTNKIIDSDGLGRYDISIKFSDSTTIYPKENYKFLMIDGVLIPNAQIVIVNDKSLVPIKTVSENLGAKVEWIGSERKVSIQKGDTVISLNVGAENAIVNGAEVQLDVPATIIDNKTYVPLRFIGESLNARVGYYNKTAFKDYPVVWLESSELLDNKIISKEDSLKNTKQIMLLALDNVASNEENNIGPDLRAFIKDAINNLTCTGEVSRFWIMADGYRTIDEDAGNIYVDKYTGDVFYFRGAYRTFWVDNFNDSSIMSMYLVG